MTRFQLFQLIRRNLRLRDRRSAAFEQNTIAKVLMLLGAGIFICYLIFFGVILGIVAKDEGADGTGLIIAFLPAILTIDFFLRFMVQQTPLMLIKPYILLPVSKYTVIEHFLLSSIVSAYNFLWLALFLPYAIIAWSGGCSIGSCLMVVIIGFAAVCMNSQMYLTMRTLLNRSLLWWLAVIVVLALPWVPGLVWPLDDVLDFYMTNGTTVWTLLIIIAVTIALFVVNRQMQFCFVYEEISKTEQITIKHVREFKFLNRFGETGEYLKLEVKSVMRNKVMKARFRSSLIVIVIFSAMIAYTPVYDGIISTNFWCFYCFALYGVTSLIKIMCPEGNYIDLLMTHRENILSLLRAKYYFHCIMLIVPFVIQMPAVFTGKFTMLMMFAYLLICTGPLYMILFETAIYNNQTLPLQQKLTGKANIENGRQLIIELIAFIAPIALVNATLLLADPRTAYLVLIAVGLIFTIAHPWWLRRVYRCMMARRYVNLEGFHASR